MVGSYSLDTEMLDKLKIATYKVKANKPDVTFSFACRDLPCLGGWPSICVPTFLAAIAR